jgi:hypothetical protein
MPASAASTRRTPTCARSSRSRPPSSTRWRCAPAKWRARSPAPFPDIRYAVGHVDQAGQSVLGTAEELIDRSLAS